MNLDDILNLQRLQCTGDVARAGWVIDQDAVIQAMDILGIKLPVHIRFMTGIYRHGSHYCNSKMHKITIDQNKTMENANFTLWHELTHCKQAESVGIKNWDDAYRAGRGRHGKAYEENIYELEANQTAARNEHIMLLARSD